MCICVYVRTFLRDYVHVSWIVKEEFIVGKGVVWLGDILCYRLALELLL